MAFLTNPALLPFLPLIVLVVILLIGYSLRLSGEDKAVPPAPPPPPAGHDGP